jgi:transposase InsO family protein
LLERKYAQRGATAILWELKGLHVRSLPEVWTINRILRRRGLLPYIKPAYRKQGLPYPALQARRPNVVHELDLVGPRYLHGGIRFYGLQLIDIYTNAVALAILDSKRDVAIVQALLEAWCRLGLPRYLQLDNELSFRGSNRYPRSFGLLIRLCLYFGIEVVFIPEGEPWRNGIVERFNDVYEKLFFRPQHFAGLVELRHELLEFERFHNRHHRYSKLGQRTPNSMHLPLARRRRPTLNPASIRNLPWKDGRISFVRLTDDQGTVRFFTERFLVDRSLVHEYVKGTIDTKQQLLRFSHQGRRIKTVRYTVSKNTKV